MIIATVLRSGGEYTSEHVLWLRRQIPEKFGFICFSDIPIDGIDVIPLQFDWPGWWAKMEIYNPQRCSEDLFYLDLDTVITGDISELAAERSYCILSDFYHPDRFQSSVVYIPHSEKEYIWSVFISCPDYFMRNSTVPHVNWGDQGFLFGVVRKPFIWQEKYPGYIAGFKIDVVGRGEEGWHNLRSKGNGTIPEGTRIVCFHGHPRPWETNYSWVPPLND